MLAGEDQVPLGSPEIEVRVAKRVDIARATQSLTGRSTVRTVLGGFAVSAFVCAVKGVGLQWVQFPPGNWVAPAGSYRSGGGGNETVGAFETDGPLGGSASRQAVT
jgi:hypothetical protein